MRISAYFAHFAHLLGVSQLLPPFSQGRTKRGESRSRCWPQQNFSFGCRREISLQRPSLSERWPEVPIHTLARTRTTGSGARCQ